MTFPHRILVIILFAALAHGCHSAGSSRAARQNTDLARHENESAFRLIDDRKFNEAEAALKKAIDADVMFGPAHNNLGLVYYQQNKLYDAAWEFQNAIRLMPYQPEPRNNLGLVFEKAGKLQEAVDAYAKARQMQPDNPEFLSNLARAKVRRGDRDDETKKLLEEVVFKDSRAEWTHWARMNLFRMTKEESTSNTSTRPTF